MRVLAAYVLSLALIASPAMAKAHRTSDDGTPKADSTTDAAAKAKTDTTATASKTDNAPAKSESTALEVELQQLRDLLEAQAQQLKAQNDQLKQQQEKMDALEKQLNSTKGTNAGTASSVSAMPAGVNASESTSAAAAGPASGAITAGISNRTSANSNASAAQGDEPVALHFKGITLTPGGFMAAETVYRTKALSADVNTPFTSIPLPGASNANVSEFNASGRQSRISMLVEGKLSNVKIGGYYEADFLGAGSTSNSNQSNSYVYRQRQIWGQAAFDNGFTVTGGQMWSLITQTTHGMDNRTEYLPLTIDAQYQAGFSWARQYGMRFTKDFDNKLWLGFAVEESQETFKVHGNPTTTTGAVTVDCVVGTPNCPASGTTTVGTTTAFTNFLLGASGTSGGLLNPLANYSYNASPDFVFKAVLEPGVGHYEIFGVYSRFRDVVFPCEVATNLTPLGCPNIASSPFSPSAALSFNDSRNGGGVGGNALWNLFSKHLDLGVHFFGGNGIGRYGSGGLTDATIRPDGTIALLKNYQGLGTIVLHPTPKLDIYMNAGGDYASRAFYSFTNLAGTTTTQEGYGNPAFNNSGCYTTVGPTTTTPVGTTAGAGYVPSAPGTCTGDPRSIIEGTLGFWYRFYQGSRGRVQFGMQYSYAELSTWSGKPATNVSSPNGVGSPSTAENMWFTSLRYYLP
jgi:hypothetical protein